MKKFNREGEYVVNGAKLDKIRRVGKRLYSENKLTGDQMRDLAQIIDACLEDAVEYKDPDCKKEYEVEVRYEKVRTYYITEKSESDAIAAANSMFQDEMTRENEEIEDIHTPEIVGVSEVD